MLHAIPVPHWHIASSGLIPPYFRTWEGGILNQLSPEPVPGQRSPGPVWSSPRAPPVLPSTLCPTAPETRRYRSQASSAEAQADAHRSGRARGHPPAGGTGAAGAAPVKRAQHAPAPPHGPARLPAQGKASPEPQMRVAQPHTQPWPLTACPRRHFDLGAARGLLGNPRRLRGGGGPARQCRLSAGACAPGRRGKAASPQHQHPAGTQTSTYFATIARAAASAAGARVVPCAATAAAQGPESWCEHWLSVRSSCCQSLSITAAEPA